MSRRKRRPGGAAAAGGEPAGRGSRASGGEGARAPRSEPGGRARSGGEPGRRRSERPWPRVAVDLAVLIAVFAVTVGIAELAGAANLGVALGVGQVVFALALVALLLRE